MLIKSSIEIKVTSSEHFFSYQPAKVKIIQLDIAMKITDFPVIETIIFPVALPFKCDGNGDKIIGDRGSPID